MAKKLTVKQRRYIEQAAKDFFDAEKGIMSPEARKSQEACEKCIKELPIHFGDKKALAEERQRLLHIFSSGSGYASTDFDIKNSDMSLNEGCILLDIYKWDTSSRFLISRKELLSLKKKINQFLKLKT